MTQLQAEERTGTKYLGKNVARLGGVERVTGSCIYGIDVVIPNAAWGGVLRSPHANARILGIDTGEAERMPGVYGVVTGQDAPDVRYGRTLSDRYILARDRVRWHGDPVAAVAADSAATLKAALAAIRVEYEPLPAVVTAEEAMRPDAPVLHPDVPRPANLPAGTDANNVCAYFTVHTGDADAALAEADLVVEEVYETQMVHPQYLEPRSTIAQYDEADGRLTIWAAAQSPFNIRTETARLLQMPVGKIRVIVPEIGGGFGGKGAGVASAASLEPICGLLAMKAKRPVRIVLDKAEETVCTSVRAPAKIWMQSAVKRDGTITARKAKIVLDTGAYSGSGGLSGGSATRMLAGWYNIPNIHNEGYVVCTNKQVCGSVRGPGGIQATFPVESHMDTIAARLGMDPIELRVKNMPQAGDRTPAGQLLRDVALKETLLTAAEHIGWGKIELKENQGIGFASSSWGEGAGAGTGALVKVNEDGSASVMIGKVDYGTAIKFAIPMIVAEELGLSLDDITMMNVDTDSSPWDAGTVGSMTTVNSGNAARLAAIDARQQLFVIAARQLDASPDELEAIDRQIRVKDAPERSLPLSVAATAAHFQLGEVIGRGYYDPRTVDAEWKRSGMSPTYASHAALVEVDRETGQVSVLKYVAVHDVGLAIHPDGVEGQVEGGVVQGLGQALCEQILHDATGKTLNPTFVDYLMPTTNIVPEIETVIVEGYLGHGPYGAKGVGEIGCLPPPAAIANAIYHAVGVRLHKLPLSPESLLRALREQTAPLTAG